MGQARFWGVPSVAWVSNRDGLTVEKTPENICAISLDGQEPFLDTRLLFLGVLDSPLLPLGGLGGDVVDLAWLTGWYPSLIGR